MRGGGLWRRLHPPLVLHPPLGLSHETEPATGRSCGVVVVATSTRQGWRRPWTRQPREGARLSPHWPGARLLPRQLSMALHAEIATRTVRWCLELWCCSDSCNAFTGGMSCTAVHRICSARLVLLLKEAHTPQPSLFTKDSLCFGSLCLLLYWDSKAGILLQGSGPSLCPSLWKSNNACTCPGVFLRSSSSCCGSLSPCVPSPRLQPFAARIEKPPGQLSKPRTLWSRGGGTWGEVRILQHLASPPPRKPLQVSWLVYIYINQCATPGANRAWRGQPVMRAFGTRPRPLGKQLQGEANLGIGIGNALPRQGNFTSPLPSYY